jgi:hypothetical protein
MQVSNYLFHSPIIFNELSHYIVKISSASITEVTIYQHLPPNRDKRCVIRSRLPSTRLLQFSFSEINMHSALKIILGFHVTAIPDLLQYVRYAIAINLCVGIKRLHAINNIFNYLDNIFDMKLF